MGLSRINRGYSADDEGLREIGSSSQVQAETIAAARRIAAVAAATGHGTYTVAPTVVRAGWANEPRAGASVRELAPDPRDARDAVLARAVETVRTVAP